MRTPFEMCSGNRSVTMPEILPHTGPLRTVRYNSLLCGNFHWWSHVHPHASCVIGSKLRCFGSVAAHRT